MKAKTFDRKFHAGEQIIDQLELGKAPRRLRREAGQCGFSCMDGWLTRQCLTVVYDKLGRHTDAQAEHAKLASR